MSERKTAEEWEAASHGIGDTRGRDLNFNETAEAARLHRVAAFAAAMAQEYDRGQEAMREDAAALAERRARRGVSLAEVVAGWSLDKEIRALPTKPAPDPGQSNPLRDAGFGPELDAIAREDKACWDAPRVRDIDADGKPVPACPRCGLHHRPAPDPAPKEHCPLRLAGQEQEPHMPCDTGDFSRDAPEPTAAEYCAECDRRGVVQLTAREYVEWKATRNPARERGGEE